MRSGPDTSWAGTESFAGPLGHRSNTISMGAVGREGGMPADSDREERDVHEETADILSLLNDPARLEMLLTLGAATQPQGSTAFAFSEFRDAVDIDDSGRFNYHLDQLRDTFIEQTEDGYRPTYPGLVIYMLIKSGSLTGAPAVDPADTGIDCLECPETIAAGYENQLLSLRCQGCETLYTRIHVPPGCVAETGGLHRFQAAMQYTVREVLPLRHGVCPNCGSSATRELLEPAERRSDRDKPTLVSSCARCEYWMQTGFGLLAAVQPEVVSAYIEHGIDLLSGSSNHLLSFMVPENSSVEARDPWRMRLRTRIPTGELVIDLDADGEVTDIQTSVEGE